MLARGQGVRRTAVLWTSPAPWSRRAPTCRVVAAEGVAPTTRLLRDVRRAVPATARRWSAADRTQRGADVAVLSRAQGRERCSAPATRSASASACGTASSRVVGVVDDWNPVPRYYAPHQRQRRQLQRRGRHLRAVRHAPIDRGAGPNGNMSCNGEPRRRLPGPPRVRVHLDPVLVRARRRGRPRRALQDWLDGYVRRAAQAGPPAAPAPNDAVRRDGVAGVHGGGQQRQPSSRSGSSFGFLLLCLVNTMGLLLAKFSARAAGVGVRRALGATRGGDLPPVPGRDRRDRPGRRRCSACC